MPESNLLERNIDDPPKQTDADDAAAERAQLSEHVQRRNSLVFILNNTIGYFVAPVFYVGVLHAAILSSLGFNDTIANLPESVYMWMAPLPVVIAWFWPSTGHLWRMLVTSYVFKGSAGLVAAALFFMAPRWLAVGIDVHGHFGRYVGEAGNGLADAFYSGDAAEVVRRASAVNIVLTIVSPLTALKPPFQADSVAGNIEAAHVVADTPGLKQSVVIDPLRRRTYEQAEEMLAQPQCVGITIHPEEHGYLIRDHARPIFEFAARHNTVMLTHSSEQNSLAADFIPWANEFPEVRLILAHIGCGWDGDLTHQVRAIQQTRHGNLFADTSSARSITPGLIEWAVREIGVDRVLFGTDTPLYHTAMQRARVDHADLSEDAKRKILRDNALRLSGAKLGQTAT